MQRCSAVKVARWRENTTRCALAFLLLENGSEATSNSFKEADIINLCGVAKAARGTTGVANNRLCKLLEQLQAASAAAQKLSLAALAAEKNATALASGQAAVAAKQCGTDALNELKTAVPSALVNVANAAAASGALTEVISILQQNGAQGSNTKCIAATQDNKAGSYKSMVQLECPEVFINSVAQLDKPQETVIAATGFPTLGSGETTITHSGGTDCIFTNGQDLASAMWGGKTAVNVGGGIIQITPHSAGSASAKVNAAGTKPTAYKLEPDGNSQLQRLYKAVTGPIHIPDPTCATSEGDLLTQVLDASKLKVALKPTLIALGQITEQTADTKLKELLDKVAVHESEHSQHLVKLLGQPQIIQVKSKEAELQKINKLAISNNLPGAAFIAVSEIKTMAKK
uniref:Variant surface glycoprotein 1125.2647 n=1 Tax=Trypanosoma brucei TaxID=5691 RepID=A0A1J0R885_9TRYP|nr:variant surface glycoprotein 1125.2647 [Trypanosoma brucei]